MKINANYLNLKDNYLFATIAQKVRDFSAANPEKTLIRLGIGDVTLPLAPSVVAAMKSAADEMADKSTFKGYGPDGGYEFLRQAIADYYNDTKNVALDLSEIFVSDGAKSDVGNIVDIFSRDTTVLIPDPVYPVYLDTNIMDGRKIVFINGNEINNFLPLPTAQTKADIIYLCSPNNPSGASYNREQLKIWVDFAIANNAVILYDAAYEIFVTDKKLPTSIYEIEGAKKCAIEFCSLSKTAGFTGTRCGYTIVPHDLILDDTKLNSLWARRQSTKFNQVSYVIQKAAAAVFTKQGLIETRENVAYYLENARLISATLKDLGIWHTGGDNSPYIWLKCPNGYSSWEYFDYLLNEINVVGTPGAGFGKMGEGFFRLSAFGSREGVIEAMKRLKDLQKS